MSAAGVPVEHEPPRPSTGESFTDALTFCFGDPATDLYGLARLGLAGAQGTRASGLVMLLADGAPAAARAEGDVQLTPEGWGTVSAAGLSTEVIEPLESWRLSWSGETGEGEPDGLELEFTALGGPAVLEPASPVAQTGGMQGYEALCRVRGLVTLAGRERTIDCLGQRGHSWGAPDWGQIELARSVSAWLDEQEGGLTLSAVRPVGARGHDSEAVAAVLWRGEPPVAVAVQDARLSTTYDPAGHHRRAGLELWLGEEDEFPLRGAGQLRCGASLDLGRLRLDCGFYDWQLDGRHGVGRYDIIRRA